MRDWLGLVRLGAQNGVMREMGYIVLFTAALQERGGGGWRKLVMELGEGVCYASGSTVPAVVCHTEHRDSLFLISSVSLSTHLPLSLTLLLSLSLALCMTFQAF